MFTYKLEYGSTANVMAKRQMHGIHVGNQQPCGDNHRKPANRITTILANRQVQSTTITRVFHLLKIIINATKATSLRKLNSRKCSRCYGNINFNNASRIPQTSTDLIVFSLLMASDFVLQISAVASNFVQDKLCQHSKYAVQIAFFQRKC